MRTIVCDIKGNLGEQLFQLFTFIAYSLNENDVNPFILHHMEGKYYWNDFLESFRSLLIADTYDFTKLNIEDLNENSDMVLFHIRDYSYMNFNNMYASIIHKFSFPEIGKRETSLCSIWFEDELSDEYYLEAMEHVRLRTSNITFIAVGKEPRFPNIERVFSAEEDEGLLLRTMYSCAHNIGGYSLLSWWGAYMNANENKIVVCPKTEKNDFYPYNWKQI